jgi:triphosphatase
MSVERELKFRVARDKLERLTEARIAGARLGQGADQHLVSTYFDTPKQKLHRCGFTLRVREAGDQYTQTVKTSRAGSFARDEWEANIPHGEPDFRQLGSTPLRHLATRKLRRKIEPIFRTSVHRVTRPIHLNASEIELAVDRGNLVAAGSPLPIAEVELELKSGRSADLFRVARALEREIAAELDLRSKAEQGYRLVNGDARGAVRADDIHLRRKTTASEAFDVVALSALHHFSANADSIRNGDLEAVHQMRVGLRRLRAAISIFGPVLAGSRVKKIKAELKWLTGELAPAREIDVFINDRIKPIANEVDPKRGGRAIEQQFLTQREQAFERARQAVESPRYRNLLIDLVEWVGSRRAMGNHAGQARIGAFADEVLNRRIRKASKQGRRLEGMSARGRHKLRIKIKKTRYAVDFFQSRYPEKAQDALKRLSARLKKIQNALGDLNDFIAHKDMAMRAALQAPARDRRARSFVAGVLVGQEQEAAKALMKVACDEIRRLRPLKVSPA